MNAKIVLGSLAGAALIHAVLLACSGNQAANAGDPGSSTDAGATCNACAPGTPAVQVDVETCNKSFQEPGPGNQATTTEYYAEHAYPGLTKEYLAGHVTNWWSVTPSMPNVPPAGYGLIQQQVVYVKDGVVGAGCGPMVGAASTFILAP